MKVLVTGANGHLGNNTVRFFLNEGATVLAGVRKNADISILKGLETEIVHLDYHNAAQLARAFQGIDLLVHTAAVFKRWAPDAQQEIIEENNRLARNIVNAAADAGVGKLVYVSSIAALDDTQLPMNETTWNHQQQRPYPYSKALSEKTALETARARNLPISTILPAGIIGPGFSHVTPMLRLFDEIIHKKLPSLPRFNFLLVDVMDVAKGIYLAARRGGNGERYIIGHPQAFSVEKMFEVAQQHFPQLRLKKPARVPSWLVYLSAWTGEKMSALTGKAPLMTVEDFREWWNVTPSLDISKARQELDFVPGDIEHSMVATFRYLLKSA